MRYTDRYILYFTLLCTYTL